MVYILNFVNCDDKWMWQAPEWRCFVKWSEVLTFFMEFYLHSSTGFCRFGMLIKTRDMISFFLQMLKLLPLELLALLKVHRLGLPTLFRLPPTKPNLVKQMGGTGRYIHKKITCLTQLSYVEPSWMHSFVLLFFINPLFLYIAYTSVQVASLWQKHRYMWIEM